MKQSPNKGINIAIAPFSSTYFKNWYVDRYDEFMQRLNDKYKYNFYILGGKGDIQKNIRNSGGVLRFKRQAKTDNYGYLA